MAIGANRIAGAAATAAPTAGANRWLIAATGVVMQLSLGGIYG